MNEEFSDRIRSLRKENGLTQQEVAAALKVGQTTIANYEKGTRLPDLSKLSEYADLFQVSVDHLLGRVTERIIHHPDRSQQILSPLPKFKDYMDALLARDRRGAVGMILSLKAGGVAPAWIYENFMERALKNTGDLWERGELPIWKEHFISEVTMEAMTLVKEQDPKIVVENRNLLAVVPGAENHSIGLRMISDQLETQGFQIVFLGDNLPADNIILAIQENKAHAVLLSVTLPKHLDTLTLIISRIKEVLGIEAPAILVGGQAFEGMRNIETLTGADKYCRTYEEIIHTLRRIWS